MKDTIYAIQASKGNQQAYEELVRLYYQDIFSYFVCHTSSREDAKDLTQDTFLKLGKYIKNYKPLAAFKTYLYKIAHSVYIDYLKKKKEYLYEHEETIESKQYIYNNVTLLLDSLPTDERDLLILYYYEKLTYKEIATIYNIPVSTVKYRVKNILNKCKEYMEN